MKSVKMLAILALGLMVWAPRISKAGPMGTAWTYQGRLIDADIAADGEYDFEFKLFVQSADGNQLGDTIDVDELDLIDGYFTVELDFNEPNAFNGDARWLEIGVRPGEMNDPSLYTTLSPRQAITPTPYALQTRGIYVDKGRNVGIGTSSPAGKLHVGTTPTYGDIIFFDVGGGQDDLSVDPDSAYTDNTDRIYILEVSSSAGSPDKFKWSDDNGGTWSSELNMTTSWYDLSHGVRIKWDNVNGHYDGGALPGDIWAWVAFRSYENALVVKEGKVGIGTASPEWELEVANLTAGDGAESAVTADDASGALAAYSSTLGDPFAHYAGRVSLFSDAVTMGLDLRADGSTGDMRFYTGGPWPANERMRIGDTGNVGIGATNPRARLSVGGDGAAVYSIYATGRSTGVYGEGDTTGVYGKGDSYGVYGHSWNSSGGENYGVYANAASFGSNTTYAVKAVVHRRGSNGTYYSGHFSDQSSYGTYVGLYADLRSGDAIDIAEYILDTEGNTEAGDVLVADPENDESIIKASKPYDSTVVGIVSSQPHLVMGMELVMNEETGEVYDDVDAAMLALAGRVPVKVTDENGPIKRGDLLTTSSKAGYAMKWTLVDVSQAEDFEQLKLMLAENERRRNTVVAKALENLDSGDGKIMALVNLQ